MVSKKRRAEIAALMASLRKRVRVKCVVCGKAVTGTTRRMYCSWACRQRAYRERRDAKPGE
jgi:hypothetical protein